MFFLAFLPQFVGRHEAHLLLHMAVLTFEFMLMKFSSCRLRFVRRRRAQAHLLAPERAGLVAG